MADETFILLGLNHKTTPVEIRERVALSGGYELPLQRLRQIPGCKEVYLLSTCNRVEILVVAEQTPLLEEHLIHFLLGDQIPVEEGRKYLYILTDEKAARHLFSVAASLDSLVVGEAQILGQLKEAYRFALRAKTTGPMLNKLLHKSFSVAKRVRTETAIGSSAVSISSAAVALARKIFGNLADKNILLIGAGEMAELAAQHLVAQGEQTITVANRTLSRAVALAKRFGGEAVSFEEILIQLEHADIIISSTGAPNVILEKEQVRSVMNSRRNRPLFFIDIAVPRDLDPAVNELENVFLYDIDDLSQVVEMNRLERDREATKAARIVDEEVLKFQRWREGMALTPTIVDLRGKADAICKMELEKTLAKMPALSEADKKAVEKMATAIAAKMLHSPLSYLKERACHDRANTQVKVNTIRSVFGLKVPEANDD